jgi:hypothetical protein
VQILGIGERARKVHPFVDDLLNAGRESRTSCGQYTVNDLPTSDAAAFCATLLQNKKKKAEIFVCVLRVWKPRIWHLWSFERA